MLRWKWRTQRECPISTTPSKLLLAGRRDRIRRLLSPRASFALGGFLGREPIGFRTFDQANQFGAPLQRLGQNNVVACGALRLCQNAIERLYFFSQLSNDLLSPPSPLAHWFEL